MTKKQNTININRTKIKNIKYTMVQKVRKYFENYIMRMFRKFVYTYLD